MYQELCGKHFTHVNCRLPLKERASGWVRPERTIRAQSSHNVPSVRVPVGNRWHSWIRIIQEGFNEGTVYWAGYRETIRERAGHLLLPPMGLKEVREKAAPGTQSQNIMWRQPLWEELWPLVKGGTPSKVTWFLLPSGLLMRPHWPPPARSQRTREPIHVVHTCQPHGARSQVEKARV